MAVFYYKKAISPIISAILLLVVGVILVTMVLSFGKNFTTKNLDSANTIFKEDTSLTGFINTSNITTETYNLKNLSNKDVNIVSYQVIGSGDSEILGINIPLSNPVILSPGSSTVMPYPCAPDNSFAINLITNEGTYFSIPLKTNSQNNSCSTNAAPDLVCLGVTENGTGDTNSDPYVICSVSDLNNIRANLGKHYRLGKNLDLGVSPYNDGNGWEPIGTSTSKFTGSFDGNGHKISNLYINRPTTNYVGLFGYTDSNSIIQNLFLENPNIVGYGYVGALVGTNAGTIQNCNLDNVNIMGGSLYVGGLAGRNQGNIISSYSQGTVRGIGATGYQGGLVGSNSGIITKSYSEGTVIGQMRVGGLVGKNTGDISLCYSACAVSGTNKIGGLLGENSASATNSYSMGNVIRLSGTETDFGGFVGFSSGGISKSYSTGQVIYLNSENPTDKGFSYYSPYPQNSFWDINRSLQTTSGGNATLGRTTTQMKTQSTFTDVNWDFSTIWAIQEGTTYPYLIDNVQEPLPE
jgi:hypothetical protein